MVGTTVLLVIRGCNRHILFVGLASMSLSACFGDLDDPPADTDQPGCFVQGGNCNGVNVWCYNRDVDEVSDDRNFWWVVWGTPGSQCAEGLPPDSGCNQSDEHCCPNGLSGLCFCKRYTLQALGPAYNAALGDMGPLCVGADGPVHVADPLDTDAWQDDGYPAVDDEVRAWCSDRCTNESKSGETDSLCEDARWSGQQTHPAWDPSDDFNCLLPDELNVDDPDGSSIEWDLVGGPSTPVPLGCDLNRDCADWFYPSVAAFLYPHVGSAMLIEPETRYAHYLGIESSGSELSIDMPGSGQGVDDTEDLFGQAEYTAVDCKEDVCPFFLANLSAFNTTDSWAIRVETVSGAANKTFSNVQIDLLQSTMGVLHTGLDTVAFAPGTLRLLVQFSIGGTGTGAGDHAYVFDNVDYVFAEYDGGDFRLEHEFPIQGGTATLSIGVEADEHPPVAEHDLGPTEPCDWVTGIELDSHDVSTDPDNDIVLTIWWIDGATCIDDCWVPHGSHDVALEVHDARGAVSFVPEQSVTVTNGPNCAVAP